jgi:hypothetical protein
MWRHGHHTAEGLNSSHGYVAPSVLRVSKLGPGVVAHICNPSHLGGGDMRMSILAPSGQKVSKTLYQK